MIHAAMDREDVRDTTTREELQDFLLDLRTLYFCEDQATNAATIT